MADEPDDQPTFAYEAESADGRPVRGTLDAADLAAAGEQLRSMQLRVTKLEPATRRAPLSDADLLVVHRQLAQLTDGGLPLERGLRLVANDLPRRSAAAVRAVADDLESGVPVADALARRAGAFPPAYASALAAGAAAGQLGTALANLGRHVEMAQRLRAAVWRAAGYPLAVAVALLITLAFVWGYVMPRVERLNVGPRWDARWLGYAYRNVEPGPRLDWVPPVAKGVSYGVMALLAVGVAGGLAAAATAGDRWAWAAPLVRRLPVVGPAVRWAEVARWCDGLHLGVAAGLDVPAALAVAGQSVSSADARADTEQLAADARSGRPVGSNDQPLRVLPATVPVAIALGVDRSDLPRVTAALARSYREQAEAQLAAVPAVLSPALLLVTAATVGLSLVAALLPLIVAVRGITMR